jgi:hypothetical protein
MCGDSSDHALAWILNLEQLTQPDEH